MPGKRALAAIGKAAQLAASAAKRPKVAAKPAAKKVSPKKAAPKKASPKRADNTPDRGAGGKSPGSRGSRSKALENVKEPEDWLKLYKKIEQLRKKGEAAPVDTIGCMMLGDQTQDKETYRYHTLIALMLSSQTKDEMTAAAMQRLQKHGLTLDKISRTTEKKVCDLIYGVGFHNNKAKFIKKATEMIVKDFGGKTPDNGADVMKLPGVGPKMAFLFLQSAHGKNEGIGVDVHVHRLANRYGWVDTTDAEMTRVHMETWLPKKYWEPINKLLVGWGQTVCTPRFPKCGECGAKKLCAYYQQTRDIEDMGK